MRLAPEIEDEIYRIGREALTNAFRHSGAKRVDLTPQFSDTRLIMRIHDDGHGIDSNVPENGRDGHWGLKGMRERATRICGLLIKSSSPTAGTQIQLSVPLTHHWVNFQNTPSNEKRALAADGVLDFSGGAHHNRTGAVQRLISI
jgi:nitrate/nitrite-specific signal transduction histidine kinase